MLETFLRSTSTYKEILLPSIATLQQYDKEIIKLILRDILKSKEKETTSRGVEMMMDMMGIKPLMCRLLKEAKELLDKMERLSNIDPDRGTERGKN